MNKLKFEIITFDEKPAKYYHAILVSEPGKPIYYPDTHNYIGYYMHYHKQRVIDWATKFAKAFDAEVEIIDQTEGK